MYYHTCRIDNGFGSRHYLQSERFSEMPSKVHSASFSILQSHRLQLSVISKKGLLLFLNGLFYAVLKIILFLRFVNLYLIKIYKFILRRLGFFHFQSI